MLSTKGYKDKLSRPTLRKYISSEMDKVNILDHNKRQRQITTKKNASETERRKGFYSSGKGSKDSSTLRKFPKKGGV